MVMLPQKRNNEVKDIFYGLDNYTAIDLKLFIVDFNSLQIFTPITTY